MNNKFIYAIGVTTVAIASAALVWSCAPEDEDSGDGLVEFRGFNESVSGAIFTTLADGSAVNHNIYKNKEDVYLDGGPGMNAPISAAGLPAGTYYFQVTDPSGKDLLSTDHISCRQVQVSEEGVISRVLDGHDYEWRGGWTKVDCRHETGLDQDHGAVTVQLMPFDNTPNKGGVYKVWMTPTDQYIGDPELVPERRQDEVNGELWEPGNFHGFVPRYSKTDNFKVKGGPPVATLTIDKFHDANVNGVMDAGEVNIPCWGVSVNDPLGSTNHYNTPVSMFVTEGLWAVLEDMNDDMMITASSLDGERLSIYPTADPLVLVPVEGLKGETHDVLYGNTGIENITACKVYDKDGDGQVDDDELGVAGWSIQVQGTDVRGQSYGPVEKTTGEDGCATFVGLLPGTYTVSELSRGGDWIPSGPTTATVTIESVLTMEGECGTLEGVASGEASFTNYCKGTADFGTKGYWHNKNGLAEVEDADVEYVNGLSPYAQPSSYFDAGDEPFDGQFADGSPVDAAQEAGDELAPAGSTNAEISQFLVDRNADGDAREQLAQQLLAFIFNTRHRLDGPGASIQQPDGSFIGARELIEQAIAAWEDTDDAEAQIEIKNILDALNNSDEVVFIYAEACDLP